MHYGQSPWPHRAPAHDPWEPPGLRGAPNLPLAHGRYWSCMLVRVPHTTPALALFYLPLSCPPPATASAEGAQLNGPPSPCTDKRCSALTPAYRSLPSRLGRRQEISE